MAWSTREFINFHGGRIETCISEKGSGEIGWYKRIFGWYSEKQNSRSIEGDIALRPYSQTIHNHSYV